MDHRRLALAFAFVLVLATLAGVLASAWMHAELWTGARMLGSGYLYGVAYRLHGADLWIGAAPIAIPGAFGLWLLPDRLGREELAMKGLALAALPLVLFGLTSLLALPLLHILHVPPDPLVLIGMVLLALGLVLLGVTLFATGLAARRGALLDAPFALGMVMVGLATSVSALVSIAKGFVTPEQASVPPLELLGLGAVVLVSDILAGASPLRGRARAYLAIAFSSLAVHVVLESIRQPVWPFDTEPMWFAALTNTSDAVGSLALLLGWVRLLRERGRPSGIVGLLCLAFLGCWLLDRIVTIYLANLSVDVHILDTYLVVGQSHLGAMAALVLAMPAALLHAWSKARPEPQRVGPWLAAGLASIGVPLFAIFALVLGHQGMPRRYYAYLPELQPAHRGLAVAGLLVGIASLLWVFELVRALVTPAREPGQR